MKTRKILVPTDFSVNAFRAVIYAAELTKITNGTMYLLHVIEPSLNMATMQSDSKNRSILKKRRENLNILLQTIKSVYPVKIVPIIAGGNIVETIVSTAKSRKADMIIMGTAGASNLKKFIAGTVAAGVISRAKHPVLTVPVSYPIGPPECVVFATNQFEKDKDILNAIFAVPKTFGSVIHIVTFLDNNEDSDATYIYNTEQMENYRQFLTDNYPGLKFRAELLKGEDFETEVEAYCRRQDADMIIMTTYPKSFIERLMRKSMTKKMAFYSNIPILSVPAFQYAD
jgi:nucleotide-binding universal stress UspA family protein